MKRSIIRRKNGAKRKGVTTIEIAIMIFIAALVALAIYGIAQYVLDTGNTAVDDTMSGAVEGDGRNLRRISPGN